jgi:hypothetical protein
LCVMTMTDRFGAGMKAKGACSGGAGIVGSAGER